jgi:hypothetical protein
LRIKPGLLHLKDALRFPALPFARAVLYRQPAEPGTMGESFVAVAQPTGYFYIDDAQKFRYPFAP